MDILKRLYDRRGLRIVWGSRGTIGMPIQRTGDLHQPNSVTLPTTTMPDVLNAITKSHGQFSWVVESVGAPLHHAPPLYAGPTRPAADPGPPFRGGVGEGGPTIWRLANLRRDSNEKELPMLVSVPHQYLPDRDPARLTGLRELA
jgi:hypothetical protein